MALALRARSLVEGDTIAILMENNRPFFEIAWAPVGEDGLELPPGETGLVYFAGGRPFAYHNDPSKTEAITSEQGWRTLGDIGYLDAGGYLYLTDREAHMIISVPVVR